MKLTFPKITQPIDLADYAPEMVQDDGTPALVWVWVNPPAALMDSHVTLRARNREAAARLEKVGDDKAALVAVAQELSAIGAALAELYAQLWSALSDPATHWTAEEVLALANSDANPALFGWLTSRTIALVNKHRAGIRKN